MGPRQLLNASGNLIEEKTHVTAGKLQFNYVPPGEVKFRITEDANANGRWDTGSLVEHRQPERTEYFVNAQQEDTFVSKENWETEETLDMGEIFTPITMQTLWKTLEGRERQRLEKLAEEKAKAPVQNQQQGTGMGFPGLGGGGQGGMMPGQQGGMMPGQMGGY